MNICVNADSSSTSLSAWPRASEEEVKGNTDESEPLNGRTPRTKATTPHSVQRSPNDTHCHTRTHMANYHHLPATRPTPQTKPPPPTGSSSTHTPISQMIRLRNCRRCRARSFRWRSTSSCAEGNGESGEGRCEGTWVGDVRRLGVEGSGMTMATGRRRKWVVMCTRATGD